MAFILLLLSSVTLSNTSYCQSVLLTNPYVYILVNNTIYANLSSTLSTYEQDLENDGFSVEIPQDFGENATAIREFLQTEAETREIAGALLVGDVPYANYEMEYANSTRIFPCDLYYMDLDGNWTDSDGNGVYDMHTNETGDLEPEIWIGRLCASTITWGDEDELLINYFDKNHRFRIGNLTLPRRALAYIDDEFVNIAENVKSSLSMIYGNETTLVTDPNTTNATDYKNRLNDTMGYEWLHLVAHGNYKKHGFKTSTQGMTEVFSLDIRNIDPHVFFCNIVACDSADYTEKNYIGGSYLFADTYGLLVVGSTKLHNIWNVSDFYEPIAEGKCIGQAFKEWLEKNGELWRFTAYGMTLLGDPTLQAPRVCDVAVTDVTASKSMVVQNSTIHINVTVKNKGKGNFTETFDVKLYANTTFIGNMTATSLQPLTTTILTFSWNTTGITKGNYLISATAVLPFDNNPDDNTYTGGWVAVILKDDVTVTKVIPSKGRVVQNSTIHINVTVENRGNFTETFDVALYANTSFIGTQTGIILTSRDSTTLIFTWNTTSFARGNYLINATAVLPFDNDPSDNVYTNGWVAVTFNNDITIISVTAGGSLHDEIEVYSGWAVNINVTVRNEGVSVETFNVTVYADVNTTVIGDEIIIGTQTNITLAAGNSTTLNFTWITTGVPTHRNYTISAYAHPIPGETDMDDNTRVDGKAYVRVCGDVNGDDKVSGADIGKIKLIISGFIPKPYYPPYLPDVNGDGAVSGADIGKIKLILSGIPP